MPPRQQKEVPLTAALREQLVDFGTRGSSVSVVEWKDLGNACFKNASYLSSIRCYTKAIEKSGGGGTAVLFSNRSAAYLQSSMFAGPSLALKDAERAVQLDEMWYKGYARLGDAQLARAQLYEARRAYERARQLEPTCQLLVEALQKVNKEIFLNELEQQANRETTQKPVDGDLCNTSVNGVPKSGSDSDRRSGDGHTRSGDFHTKAFDPDTLCPSRRCAPTVDETERLIQAWKTDTYIPDDHTAMKPCRVALSEAMKEANAVRESGGITYKDQLMRTFRTRLQEDGNLSCSMKERHIHDQLQGQNVNYRCGDRYRTQYARSTDGIGLGITADSLKDHLGLDKKW